MIKYSFFKQWFFLIGFFSLASSGMSQSKLEFASSFSVEQGLSGRLVTDLLTDQRGFVWIATSNGLNQYNGTEIRQFAISGAVPNLMKDGNIQQISEDSLGRILISYQYEDTFLEAFDPETEKVQRILFNADYGLRGQPQALHFNKKGRAIVLSKQADSLLLFELQANFRFRQTAATPSPFPPNQNRFQFIQTSKGGYWIAQPKDGLFYLSPKGVAGKVHDLKQFDSLSKTRPAVGNPLNSILYEDLQERIFISLQNQTGLYQYDQQKQGFAPFAHLPQEIFYSEVWEDQEGHLIFASRENAYTVDQLFCLHPDNQYTDYTFLTQLDTKITHIDGRDFSQLFFMGTLNGVQKVVLSNPKVKQILAADIDARKGEWGPTMHGITMDKRGTVYMAREINEWYRYEPTTGVVQPLPLYESNSSKARPLECSFNLIIDGQDQLWGCGCEEGRTKFYLHKMDLKSLRTTSYETDYLPFGFAKSKDGKFWLATGSKQGNIDGSKLVSFDPVTEIFTDYLNADGSNPLEQQLPRFLLESQNGLLWIGTTNGLVRVDRAQQSSKQYTAENGLLPHSQVMVIHEDSEGGLVLGTGGGVVFFDPINESSIIYDKTDGLCNNSVCGILSDEKGNYWLSTFNGLSYFDPKAGSFQNFDISDGFSHNEFNRFSYFKHPDGQYYFGGMNGVNTFDPADILKPKTIPPLQITKLSWYNTETDSTYEQRNDLSLLKQIRIKADDSYFQIHYSLPDFYDPSNNQYQSWLEPYENDWQFLENNSFIRYNKLPAGQYQLHLKGADSKGNWSEVKTIDLLVEQVFYKTAWFLSICGLGLTALIYFFARYRLRQALEVEKLRTKIASDLHDEIGSMMTRISMGTDMLQEGVFSESEQQQELRHIAKKSRQVTSTLSDVIWSIDARKDQVKNLIDRMQEHLDELLTTAGIAFEFQQKGLPMEKKLAVNLRQNLYFIFKESINNIVKHSNASLVNVRLTNENGELILEVRDNGNQVGGSQKSGQGLRNMRMRAKRVGGQLEIDKEDGFRITLKTNSI